MAHSALPALLLAVASQTAESLECWTDGITRGQCCNAIFGPGGNSHCWDGGEFTFESCCGESYQASDCSAFITHFSFSVVGALNVGDPGKTGEAWERCANAMDLEADRCNSVNTTGRSCPECGSLSMYLPQYIQCIRLEQARETPSGQLPCMLSETRSWRWSQCYCGRSTLSHIVKAAVQWPWVFVVGDSLRHDSGTPVNQWGSMDATWDRFAEGLSPSGWCGCWCGRQYWWLCAALITSCRAWWSGPCLWTFSSSTSSVDCQLCHQWPTELLYISSCLRKPDREALQTNAWLGCCWKSLKKFRGGYGEIGAFSSPWQCGTDGNSLSCAFGRDFKSWTIGCDENRCRKWRIWNAAWRWADHTEIPATDLCGRLGGRGLGSQKDTCGQTAEGDTVLYLPWSSGFWLSADDLNPLRSWTFEGWGPQPVDWPHSLERPFAMSFVKKVRAQLMNGNRIVPLKLHFFFLHKFPVGVWKTLSKSMSAGVIGHFYYYYYYFSRRVQFIYSKGQIREALEREMMRYPWSWSWK